MLRNENAGSYWRSLVTKVMGGPKFDEKGSGYSFSDVLAEERSLALDNVDKDPKSALLCLSIADPTWKMPLGAFMAGFKYFVSHPFSSRYTDLFGVALCADAGLVKNTHELISDYLNQVHPITRGVFTPDWVQYSPGAVKRALAEYIPTVLFEPGALLLFPAPGYPVITDPKNNRGAEVHTVPMTYIDGQWDVDYQASARLFRDHNSRKRFMYLNIPENPTGRAYSRLKWTAVLDWAKENGVVLIVDEAYTHLRFSSSYSVLDVPGWEECCIVLQSVSKGWNATGLRFGWIVADPTLIKAFRVAMDVKDSGMFGPTIAMGLWCLRHPGYTQTTCARYKELHTALADGLQKAGFKVSMPDAGLCQLTPAPRSANGTQFADAQECAQWFRKNLRISLMHYTVNNQPWLRWAVTLKPVPECGLPNEASVIAEAVRRLQSVKFTF